MGIQYFTEDVLLPKLKKRKSTNWIKSTILSEGKRVGDISFIFCSDNYLLEINKAYLDHDYLTDIITFDYVEGTLVSGDIFISVDRVLDNSADFKTTFEDELNRILIHGVLHLVGYKDKNKNDKLLMTEKEDFYLKLLNDN
jgi:probable rRNA maturation factor